MSIGLGCVHLRFHECPLRIQTRHHSIDRTGESFLYHFVVVPLPIMTYTWLTEAGHRHAEKAAH